MTEEIVRVLRIIEYIGPREWVAKQIADRQLKGTKVMQHPRLGEVIMNEAIIGDYPEMLKEREEYPEPSISTQDDEIPF